MDNSWRLSQAIAALHGGIRSLREHDADLGVDINELLPEETAAVQDAIVGVLRAAKEADALSSAAAAMELDIAQRKVRFRVRTERLRGIAFAAMDALGIKKMELPDMTVSIQAGRPSLQITDEKTIPDQYWRVKRELDRTLIASELKEGVVIEGAELSNSMPHIVVRSR
jgi:hypothetical protein